MLLKIALLVCGITCTLGAALPDGMMPLMDERIIGGYRTTIYACPYQVSIQDIDNPFCGGSIYNKFIIISAAHCLKGKVASNIKVRVGSSFRRRGGMLIRVSAFKTHPDFNRNTFRADVAVLQLVTPLTFGDTIQPITLPGNPPVHGTNVKVSGWGTLIYGGNKMPKQLRAVNVSIISWSECRSSDYDYGNKILAGMICAAGPGKDSCRGDSGGPLVHGKVLVGIVSWGYGCAQSNYPGVYTSTAYYKNWIVQTANDLAQF